MAANGRAGHSGRAVKLSLTERLHDPAKPRAAQSGHQWVLTSVNVRELPADSRQQTAPALRYLFVWTKTLAAFTVAWLSVLSLLPLLRLSD